MNITHCILLKDYRHRIFKFVLNTHPFPLNITHCFIHNLILRGFDGHGHFRLYLSPLKEKLHIKIWKSTQNIWNFTLIHYSLWLNNSYLKILGRSDGKFVDHPASLR